MKTARLALLAAALFCTAVLGAACHRAASDGATPALPAATAADDDDGASAAAAAPDTDPLPSVEVTIQTTPAGNPLAVQLHYDADRPCVLSGIVWTDGELGVGRSLPALPSAASGDIWFTGLLADTTFEYRLFEGGDPNRVVNAGSFKTPRLPWWTPMPKAVADTAEAESGLWLGMTLNLVRQVLDAYPYVLYFGLVMIVDREGRPRYFHEVGSDPAHGQFLEGLSVLQNGDLAWSNRVNLMAAKPTGDEYVLFPVQLQPPYITPTHHVPYIYDDGDDRSALVLFNRYEQMASCGDVGAPDERTIADGVARIDSEGVETWRWLISEHLDAIPPDSEGLCGCELNFWGPNTADFSHANRVVPIPGQNALLLSLRNISRLIKIDGATGEVVWQMGAGLDFQWVGDEAPTDRWFSWQHDPLWLPNNHVLMFDNGDCRFYGTDVPPYSRALELAVDEDAMTVQLVWEHHLPFSQANGTVIRLANGNTIIHGGWDNWIVETSPDDREIWTLQYPLIFQMPNVSSAQPYPAMWDYSAAP